MLRVLLTIFVVSMGHLAAGCAPEVGDECTSNTECGTELVCDTSMPGGYCTRSQCEPNSCPEEAACIRFEDDTRFCMLRCEEDGDCRDGYVCVRNFGDVPFCDAIAFTPATTAAPLSEQPLSEEPLYGEPPIEEPVEP